MHLRCYLWLFCSSDDLGILHWNGGLGERALTVSAFLFSPVFFAIGATCGTNFGPTLLVCGRFFGCGLGAIFLERLTNSNFIRVPERASNCFVVVGSERNGPTFAIVVVFIFVCLVVVFT
jgi:hypothetical protein